MYIHDIYQGILYANVYTLMCSVLNTCNIEIKKNVFVYPYTGVELTELHVPYICYI